MLLIGLDTETTGTDPATAELLQLGMVSHSTRSGKSHVVMNQRCRPSSGKIPAEASEIHGIYMTDVEHQPSDWHVCWLLQLAFKDILEDESDVCLVTYNGEHYDVPVIERYRVDVKMPHIDVYRLVQRHLWEHGLKLGEVYQNYVGKELDGAHDAIHDVHATLAILCKYLEETGKRTMQVVEELAKPALLPQMYFGKHQGTPFHKIPRGYLRWMKENLTHPSMDLSYTIDYYLEC